MNVKNMDIVVGLTKLVLTLEEVFDAFIRSAPTAITGTARKTVNATNQMS